MRTEEIGQDLRVSRIHPARDCETIADARACSLLTVDPLRAPGPDIANPAPARWWSTGDSDGSYLVRWVIGILGLSACSVMAVGVPVGVGLILSAALAMWASGVRGILTRTKVCATVTANRDGRDEASAGMQAAINACQEGDVVRLSAGAFQGQRLCPDREEHDAAWRRAWRDDPAEDGSDCRAGTDPHHRVVAVVAEIKEWILTGRDRDFPNDDNVRVAGLMFDGGCGRFRRGRASTA